MNKSRIHGASILTRLPCNMKVRISLVLYSQGMMYLQGTPATEPENHQIYADNADESPFRPSSMYIYHESTNAQILIFSITIYYM